MNKSPNRSACLVSPVHRSCVDGSLLLKGLVSHAQVRALQQQQLEALLGLLQGLQPFADLGRDKLVSLAIFVRPLMVPKDHVIVQQGDPVDTLYLIKQGDIPCLSTISCISSSKSLGSRATWLTPCTSSNKVTSPVVPKYRLCVALACVGGCLTELEGCRAG